MKEGRERDDADAVAPLQRTCGTMPVHERLKRSVPGYIAARAASEDNAWAFATRRTASEPAAVTVVPVVVHVVHDPQRPQQDISVAQIASQIAVLNQDYRSANPDLLRAPEPYRGYAADARVEFELATVDPRGLPTSGITRTASSAGPYADDDAVKARATGGADPWPSGSYLNIWVCRLAGGLLGYAQFPGGPPETDGVVILDTAFGTLGTATAPFDRGRTATHEIGHWLNLRHIWGDDGDGCWGSDFVDDTPNQAGPNYGSPVFPHVSCSNHPHGDMFMNYMDYVDDEAMFMLTSGQVERIQACLARERHTVGRITSGEYAPVV